MTEKKKKVPATQKLGYQKKIKNDRYDSMWEKEKKRKEKGSRLVYNKS